MKTTDQEDNVNLRILHCLSQHGRMPYAKIAESLRLSPNAVRDRVLSMERRGVIRAYRAVTDDPKLGRTCHVLALLQPVQPDSRALRAAQEHPDILEVHECGGRYGLMVEAVGQTVEAIDALLAELLYDHGFEPAEFIVLGTPAGRSETVRMRPAARDPAVEVPA